MKQLVLEAIHLNNAYTGNGMYMAFYYLTLIFILFCYKEKTKRATIVYPACIMLVFIFLVAPIINQYIFIVYDKDTGGRLFWVLFVTIVAAYGGTRLIQEQSSRKNKILLLILLVPIIFLSGVFKFSDALYHPIENEYRLPQYGLDICETVLAEKEEPKLLVPYEIAHIFRQYSTRIKLLYGEDASYGRIFPAKEEYVQACSEMDSTSPNVEYVATLAYKENCDFIIFDHSYHILDQNPELFGYNYFATIDHFDLYKKRD